MSFLILGLLIFLGAHSVRIFAGGWRDAQVVRLGEMRWKGVYSLISAVGLGLIIWGYGMARADSPMLWVLPQWTRHLAALLTLPVFILLLAAYVPGSHIKAVVGHPMVLAVKTWAVAHLLVNGKLPAVVLFGAFMIWAVLNYISSRRRDRTAGRTYPPLGWSRDALIIVIGLVAWTLFVLYGHRWLIGVQPFRA